jgi:hypothetical protein
MNATCGKETTMRDPKPLLTSIIVAVALVVPMAVWAADHTGNDHAPPTITFETTHDEGVGWFFPLNHTQCGAIPEEVGDINPIDRAPSDPLGDRVSQSTTTVEVDGSRQIDRIDVVTGMAQDSNGDRYIWTYENHPVYGVPPGEGPVNVSVRMFDRFRLIGNGFTMEFSFDRYWEFEVPSGSAFDPGPEFTGVVFPNNPVSPTNVFNYEELSFQGVRGCDPL